MIRVGTMVALFGTLALSSPALAQGRGQGGGSDAHKPPPGMCRIWIDGVPANRQPAPTDCPTAIKRRPQNGRVIFGDPVDDPRQDERAKRPDKKKDDPDSKLVRRLREPN